MKIIKIISQLVGIVMFLNIKSCQNHEGTYFLVNHNQFILYDFWRKVLAVIEHIKPPNSMEKKTKVCQNLECHFIIITNF